MKLRVIPVDDNGQILLDEYQKLLNPKTKFVSFTQVSNALGTVTPAKQIIDLAHSAGAKVYVLALFLGLDSDQLGLTAFVQGEGSRESLVINLESYLPKTHEFTNAIIENFGINP